MHACTCSVVSCGRVFCRLCNGQRPNDEVSGLIVDLVFLGLFFVAFSSSRALPFALVSRDLSLPRLLVRIHIFSWAACVFSSSSRPVCQSSSTCRLSLHAASLVAEKRNGTALNFRDETSASSPLYALSSQFGAARVSVVGHGGLSARKSI